MKLPIKTNSEKYVAVLVFESTRTKFKEYCKSLGKTYDEVLQELVEKK